MGLQPPSRRVAGWVHLSERDAAAGQPVAQHDLVRVRIRVRLRPRLRVGLRLRVRVRVRVSRCASAWRRLAATSACAAASACGHSIGVAEKVGNHRGDSACAHSIGDAEMGGHIGRGNSLSSRSGYLSAP